MDGGEELSGPRYVPMGGGVNEREAVFHPLAQKRVGWGDIQKWFACKSCACLIKKNAFKSSHFLTGFQTFTKGVIIAHFQMGDWQSRYKRVSPGSLPSLGEEIPWGEKFHKMTCILSHIFSSLSGCCLTDFRLPKGLKESIP